MVVAGTADAITMVEAGAQEVEEEVLVQALMLAQERSTGSAPCRSSCATSSARSRR